MAEEKDPSPSIDPEIRALLPKNPRPEKEKFWKKVRRWFKRAGKAVIRWALILYYVATDPDTPQHVRNLIWAALLYFILPTDTIPDFIPGIGFLDDLLVLLAIAHAIAEWIKPEHREQAETYVKELFGEEDP